LPYRLPIAGRDLERHVAQDATRRW
jgi:hypothetical protein